MSRVDGALSGFRDLQNPGRFVLYAILLCALAAGGLLFLSQRALQHEPAAMAMEQRCILGSDFVIPVSELDRYAHRFDCEPGLFARTDRSYVWVRIDKRRLGQGTNDLNLEVEGAPVDRWIVAHRSADGMIGRAIDPAEGMANFVAGTRLSLPLTRAESRSDTLYVGVHNPWSRVAFGTLELIDRDQAQVEYENQIVLFAIYFAILLVPVVYGIMLFIALGYPFLLFHACSVACYAVYIAASSSVLLLFLPDLDIWERILICYVSMALGTGFACLFFLQFLERGMMDRWGRLATKAGVAAMIMAAVGIATVGPYFPFDASHVYHALILIPVGAFFYVITVAIWRGSKVVWFLAAGWSIVALSAVDQVLRGLDVHMTPFEFDWSIYLGFAIEAMVTACGAAYRVFSVRRELDEALGKERELQRMAWTDGLTGLANRRCFDEVERAKTRGTIMLADVDHFKQINDRFGHQAGDDVLRKLGLILKASEGPPWNARAYRIGGEEFAVVSNVRDLAMAARHAEMLRAAIERELTAAIPDSENTITVSIGLAPIDREGIDREAQVDQALRAADAALYLSKASGRNRVTEASTMEPAANLISGPAQDTTLEAA